MASIAAAAAVVPKRAKLDADAQPHWRTTVIAEGKVGWFKEVTSAIADPSTFSSLWDILPKDIQGKIIWDKERLEMRQRLEMGWSDVHKQMDHLPRCKVHDTVSRRFISF